LFGPPGNGKNHKEENNMEKERCPKFDPNSWKVMK